MMPATIASLLVGRAAGVVRRRKEAHGDGWLFPSGSKEGYFNQKSTSEAVYYRMPYCRIAPDRKRVRLTVEQWAPHDLSANGPNLSRLPGLPSGYR